MADFSTKTLTACLYVIFCTMRSGRWLWQLRTTGMEAVSDVY